MIVIVGAGISGLTSALTLRNLGHRVVLVDKGPSVGGRMATRYFDDERGKRRYIDTASRYVDLDEDTPRFNELLRSHFPDQCSEKRVRGRTGINSICKALATLLHESEILTTYKVTSTKYDNDRSSFRVKATSRETSRTIEAEGVILTPPVPQSLELLSDFTELSRKLETTPPYYRSLLLLLWPNKPIKPSDLEESTAIFRIVSQIHIEENIEPMPIAVHATYGWSEEHYHLKDEEIKEMLMRETGITGTADYDRIQVKRWVSSAVPLKSGALLI